MPGGSLVVFCAIIAGACGLRLSRDSFVPPGHLGPYPKSSISGGEVCTADVYVSSPLEKDFLDHANEKTDTKKALCSHLNASVSQSWIEGLEGKKSLSKDIFSKMCRKGHPPQLVEPLAGLLRDPRVFCVNDTEKMPWTHGQQRGFDTFPKYMHSVDYLLMADAGALSKAGGKKVMYDAGATRFEDAMHWFTDRYGKVGIELDHIYAWQFPKQDDDIYWGSTDPEVRKRWESKVTFYNGVPIDAKNGSANNVVKRIFDECHPDDFCTLKLDIDTAKIELDLVDQMLANPKETGAKLDEFFWEVPPHGLRDEEQRWKEGAKGTYEDYYTLLLKFRQMGVAAHGWV